MVKVKICGLTRPEDIAMVNRHAPDYAGFVFAPGRRQVSRDEARQLISGLSACILPVGVFVNDSAEDVARTAAYCGLSAVQLHGDEDVSYIVRLRSLLSHITIIKVIRIRDDAPVPADPVMGADLLLLDTFHPAVYGGGGITFDWNHIKNMQTPYLLAGGLTIGNLPDALTMLNPYGVDVSSGVETDGCKDEEKTAAFIAMARRRIG